MDITIEKIYWLPHLKSIWKELYAANSSLSIFQSYEFMLNFWKNSWIYCIKEKEFPIFYLVKDKGTASMIAPLCKKKNGTYEIMGTTNGCEYCDFIYAHESNIDLYVRELVDYLKCPLTFARVKEQSKLCDLYRATSVSDERSAAESSTVALAREHLERLPFVEKGLPFEELARLVANRWIKDESADE